MIPDSFHAALWSLALVAVVSLALWRGGAPERVAVAGVVVAHLITVTFRPGVVVIWHGTQWPTALANFETFAVAVVVLFRSRRWWPIPSAAFQGTSLCLYLAPLVQPLIRASAYHASSVAFDYLNLLAITLGIILEASRPSGHKGRPSSGSVGPP